MPVFGLIPGPSWRRWYWVCLVVFAFLLFTFAFGFPANTQTQPPRGLIRLQVRVKSGETNKVLPRKRFFLIKGSLDQNKALVEKILQTEMTSRECYYRSKGASEALIKWLKENDCESVYCRGIEEKDLTGADAVPEFKTAYDIGLRSFKSPNIARRWLAVNLPEELRSGYYHEKQRIIEELIKQAEASTRASVMSIMTDRIGGASLTDIEPGMYTISNLVASETETKSILWICQKEVKPTTPTQFTLLSEKDDRIKCEIVERPLAACAKSASMK